MFAGSPRNKNILLVDDNPYDVQLTLRELKRFHLDHAVTVVHDGAEALDYLYHSGKYAHSPDIKPDVILLDTHLPKVSGLEFLQKIRADVQFKKIPVLVLTGSQDEHLHKQYESLGVVDFIEKPVDLRAHIPILSYFDVHSAGSKQGNQSAHSQTPSRNGGLW